MRLITKPGLYWLAFVLLGMSNTGCASLSYYQQAFVGQWSLLSNRRSLEDVLQDASVPANVRQRLELAQEIRVFAEVEIGLPVEQTFSSYVDTGKPYVVWNVFSAPEFSLTMESFCYPIAGCVNYKGFFKQRDAETFADSMRSRGFDVYMGGVAAYSTLGWFSDPLLNTFIHRKDEQLAALMFHELAHKILYLPGDTTFNESFATAVEQYGVRLWMESKNAEEQFGLYLATKARRDSVVRLILEFRTRLQELYSENLGREPMRLEKAQLIADLRDAYSHLVQEWVVSPGEKGNEYRYWMETEVNNAKISAVGAYTDWVPAFARLLERGSSFEQFVEKARAISELAPAERKMELIKLASPSKPE